MSRLNAVALAVLLMIAGLRRSTSRSPITTPETLATLIVGRFALGSPASFDSLVPDSAARAYVADAARQGAARHAGLARVVTRDASHAVLVLSGYVSTGNSGAETLGSRAFADFYEAARDAHDDWHVARRIHLDSLNRIRAHALHVTLVPGERIDVVDSLRIVVEGNMGFAARLNHDAHVERVMVNGHSAAHAFDAGLLWVDAPANTHTALVVAYSLAVPHDTRSWLGYMLPASGLVRDQYVWEPALNYGTDADRAVADIELRAPKAVQLATSLPQRVRVAGAWRIARGHSPWPVAGITLLYDREWVPRELTVGSTRFESFIAPGFTPARAELDSAFVHTFELLRARFGHPQSDYFAVAQRREAASSGWHFFSNTTVVAGKDGGPVASPGPFPRAFVGHELAHAWTHPSGAGSIFLMEGWATFAESYMLASAYGGQVERDFWEAQRKQYEAGGFDGHAALVGDHANGGVSYSKGAWVFRMIRDQMGEDAFDRGMREYMRIPSGQPSGAREFVACLSHAAGRDMRASLAPWLDSTTIPDIAARLDGGQLTLTQRGLTFDLQVDVAFITTANGVVHRTVHMYDRTTVVDASHLGRVTAAVLDPSRKLLMRQSGERVEELR